MLKNLLNVFNQNNCNLRLNSQRVQFINLSINDNNYFYCIFLFSLYNNLADHNINNLTDNIYNISKV